MPILSAEQFREVAAKRRKTSDVEIEGVGTVRLRALSAGDAQRFQAEVKKAKEEGRDPEDLAFPLIALSWIGEDGQLWMPESEGIAFARSLDPDAYNAIAKAVLVLNGLSTEAVEEAVKTSGVSQDDSTRTSSPATSDALTSI